MKNFLLMTVVLPICVLVGCGPAPAEVSPGNVYSIAGSPGPTPTPLVTPVIETSDETGDPPPPMTEFDRKLGVVETSDDDFICFRTRGAGLKPGTPVLVVNLFSMYTGHAQLTYPAYVEKEVLKTCANQDSDAGDAHPERTHYYSLGLKDESERENVRLGIGVVDPVALPAVVKRRVVLDVDNDGKPEYFRSCASMEGVHLTVWTGRPLKGKRIWHSYYYLHYDTEPTCNKKDWEGT